MQALAVLALLVGPATATANPFLPASDHAPLLAAIAAEAPSFDPPPGVTGITVPHHLLAADLIARGFWAASAGDYDRVILISPDHFRKVSGAFATTRAPLDTLFGTVAPDLAAIDTIAVSPLVEILPTIQAEHGVMAVAPFVAHFFPKAEIVPVIASIFSTEADWAGMAELLAPLLTPRTLVIQSTDYSHYRPVGEAAMRDQETLTAIAVGDPAGVNPLLQPSHLDSKAAQYIQLALQRGRGSRPVILANRNSADYGTSPRATTSYIVTAFLADPVQGAIFDYPEQQRLMFAGDVLLGRYFLPALRDPADWALIRDTVLDTTLRTPLVINLEGVVLDRAVSGVEHNAHVMVTDDVAPALTALNVVAASLANNHAGDLGPDGRGETIRQLERIGVRSIDHGELVDLGGLAVVSINFVGGRMVGDAIADPKDLGWVCDLDAAPPLAAFVHWGREYVTTGTAKEAAIADALAQCGVSLIIGNHSHQAATEIEALRGGATQMVFSLGNFIFDQSAPRGSGALLEVRRFEQGTLAARLVPIPNLFDLTRD